MFIVAMALAVAAVSDTITSTGNMMIKPSGDTDDYLNISTISNSVWIKSEGDGDLKIEAGGAGSVTFFDSEVSPATSMANFGTSVAGDLNRTCLTLFSPERMMVGSGDKYSRLCHYSEQPGVGNVDFTYLMAQAGNIYLDPNAAGSGAIRAVTNNTDDFGTSAVRWRNGYFVNVYTYAGSLWLGDPNIGGEIIHMGYDPNEGLYTEEIQVTDLIQAGVVVYNPDEKAYVFTGDDSSKTLRQFIGNNPEKIKKLSVKKLSEENAALRELLLAKGIITQEEFDQEKIKQKLK